MAAGGKSKGKKGKKGKPKIHIRKYNLDLFGILTFTRFYGLPFDEFMCDDKKKQKKAKPKPKKGKKGKKGKKEDVPNLPKFPELPPIKIQRIDDPKVKKRKHLDFVKEPILPYVSVGYTKMEKTTRPSKPLQKAGSIRDVLCGPQFPLPPRPQPHGGIMGDWDCKECQNMDNMFGVPYGRLHKKLRKLIDKQFKKAEYIIEYLNDHAMKAIDYYREHMQNVMDVMGPIMDDLDASEWDDHFQVRELVDKWRQLQREILQVKAEYRHLRDNQEAEIDRLLADKKAEVEAAEKRMHDLERQLKEAIDTLEDWRENHEKKIREPQEEIERLLALLSAIKNSVFEERDYLRDLLAWETKMATEQTVAEMERIIAEDINYILTWMHPAWLNLVLENKKLAEEDRILDSENHLLELEVETLDRQLNQLLAQKKRFEQVKTYDFRPPNLQATVDRYFKMRGKLQLQEFPTTDLMHE